MTRKTESSPDDVFILSLDTPEIGIQGSSSSLLDMTDLCPTASPFVPSLKAVEQCTSSARDVDELTDHSDASVICVSDADSDTETDPGEMSPEIGQCGCQRCDYGGGKWDVEDTCGRDHYQCRKMFSS